MKGFCSGFLFRLIATHMFCVAILFGRDPDPTETTAGNSNAGETFEGLAVSGRIVFAGLGRGGIHIVDFSDFGAPKTIARIPTEGATRGVAVVGNSLFVADEFLGLQIFDIADPQHPKLSGSTTMPGHPRGVAVDFPHVFIAAQDGGLQVFRINASGAPKRVGSCALAGNPARVAVLGQRAYTVGTGGVQLIDISEPSKPTLLMQGPPAEDVVATDHSVFSVDGKANVTELSAAFEPSIRQENSAMRLANGARIAASDELLCFTDGPASQWVRVRRNDGSITGTDYMLASALAVSGEYMFAAHDSYAWPGIKVYHVGSDSAPTAIVDYTLGRQYGQVAVFGNRAAIIESRADWFCDLVILDMANPREPTEIGRTPAPLKSISLTVTNGTAYIASGIADESALSIFDISDPTDIKALGSCPFYGGSGPLIVENDRAYILHNYFLRIFDVSNPSQPSQLGYVNNSASSTTFAVNGNIVAVGQMTAGVAFLDVSNPTEPIRLSVFFPPGRPQEWTNWIYGVALRGNYAFVKTGSRFLTLDVTNPTAPRTVADISILADSGEPNVGQLQLHGNYAFLGSAIVDISDPIDPTYKYTWNGPQVFDGFSGNFALVGSGNLQVTDFATGANPEKMSVFPATPGVFLTVNGGYAYPLDLTNGLRIVDVHHSAKPRLVAEFPEIRGESMTIVGKYAYIVGPNLQIFSLDGPAKLDLLATVPGRFLQVAARGNYVFLTDWNVLQIFNVERKSEPALVATLPLVGPMVVEDGYLYVGGAAVVDISNPEKPRIVNDNFRYGGCMAKHGDYLFSGDYYGIHVYDVSNPRAPWVVTQVGPPLVTKQITISGDELYLLDAFNNLHVFDISQPLNPRRVGGNSNFKANSIFATGDTLYAVSAREGLIITDLHRFKPFEPSMTILDPFEDQVHVRVRGPVGKTAVIQRSAQFGQWTDWISAGLGEAPQDFQDLDSSPSPNIYRLEIRE